MFCVEKDLSVMHSQPRFCLTPKDDLPADVVDLAWAIGQLPQETQDYLHPLLQRVLDSSQRRRRILHLIQESLDELRLERKSLLFDLEATRRERDGIGF
jgi:hypothetical protein